LTGISGTGYTVVTEGDTHSNKREGEILVGASIRTKTAFTYLECEECTNIAPIHRKVKKLKKKNHEKHMYCFKCEHITKHIELHEDVFLPDWIKKRNREERQYKEWRKNNVKHADLEYFDIANKILDLGRTKNDRTGTGTYSDFGGQMEFDLNEGFPLLTTKKLPFKVIAEELLRFVNGETNLKDFLDHDVKVWNDDGYRRYKELGGDLSKEEFIEMAKTEGFDLGRIYGAQWRTWGAPDGQTIDQLQQVIEELESNPDSRRMIVSAWNPADIPNSTLPPCHTMFQFYVADGRLSCKMFQRSADVFLGLPFNIASYALLTHMVADLLGMGVDKLIITLGDSHIYKNHVRQVREQLSRTPRRLPTLKIKNTPESIEGYTLEDFEIEGYDPHPHIAGKLSVGLED
jgi:thymidylate synthase